MSEISDFKDLTTWKEAHKLTLQIYKLTSKFPKNEIYGITSQIRRSSSSITANIAEGFARYHYKDKVKFYYNARGSTAETRNFLLLSKDLEYINKKVYNIINKQSEEVEKLINGLIRSTTKQIKD